MLGGLTAVSPLSLYSSAQGHGAWLAMVPSSGPLPSFASLPPSSDSMRLPYIKPAARFPPDAPKSLILAAEWGKQRDPRPGGHLSRKIESFLTLVADPASRGGGGMLHGMRSIGSATLDMLLVATGCVRCSNAVLMRQRRRRVLGAVLAVGRRGELGDPARGRRSRLQRQRARRRRRHLAASGL